MLLTQVNSIKPSYRKFAGVDAGFNTLLRPTMYDSYHHIVVADKPDAEPTQKIDIAGDVCESGDLFARDRPMPEIEEGDVLAILNAGAYSFSMEQFQTFSRILKKVGFSEVKVLECIVREIEVKAKGTRPKTRMAGHTGYLTFGRKL